MRRLLIGVALVCVPLAPAAAAQDVEHFLLRVDHVLALGPFAFFSSDFYRLKHLVEMDGEQLKREYAIEKARGHRTAFCPPINDKPRVGKFEYLAALRAVPPEKRLSTDTKDVLRSVLERKYPCPNR